jgi:hypothetical protein
VFDLSSGPVNLQHELVRGVFSTQPQTARDRRLEIDPQRVRLSPDLEVESLARRQQDVLLALQPHRCVDPFETRQPRRGVKIAQPARIVFQIRSEQPTGPFRTSVTLIDADRYRAR